ncbi:MAG: hypothetical protein LBL23_08835 [Coriobacteriales bacterium]|jgi:hypothetical protein|nr:hypothetical protein [Coriobacteriales bacterium]
MGRETPTVSRRGFVIGSAAAAGAAATLGLDGCTKTDASVELTESVQAQFPDAQVEYLAVASSQVQRHTNMITLDSIDYLEEAHSFDLPLGSLLYQSSDTRALVVAPGASSQALIRIGFVEFESGSFVPALGQALGSSEDYVIYDARASALAIAWVECNMVHGQWRVYATPLENGTASEQALQQAQLLDEGEGSYSPPQLAVSGNKIYWTVMPDPNGPASSEDSYLKAAEFSSVKPGAGAEPWTVYTSHGRMITNPLVSGELLTFVPRVDTDAVYYQLTTLDTATDAVQNIAILPPSLRVSDAVWLETGFAFGIEGNYDYADGLSLFGSYQQLGDGQYLYINKAPVSALVQIKQHSFVKSTKNVLGLDADAGTAIIVDTPQDCVAYGDILAGAGVQNRLVLYTTVTARVGKEKGVCRVRVFDPR